MLVVELACCAGWFVKRAPLKRKTPLKQGKALARSRLRAKQPSGGFPEEVRVAARLRSKGICEAGTRACIGQASHFHHRKLRRFKDHSLINCLHVCYPCHLHIHGNVLVSMAMGWIIASWEEPSEKLPRKGDRWRDFH